MPTSTEFQLLCMHICIYIYKPSRMWTESTINPRDSQQCMCTHHACYTFLPMFPVLCAYREYPGVLASSRSMHGLIHMYTTQNPSPECIHPAWTCCFNTCVCKTYKPLLVETLHELTYLLICMYKPTELRTYTLRTIVSRASAHSRLSAHVPNFKGSV